MAGHSKWANIRHRKGAQDAKRAQIFTRLAKAVTIAAQNGGGDPETNPSLKIAIEQARRENMPKDNIQRAIARGTGEGGERIEEVVYEAYGPGNIAMIIVCTTDNTNRTVGEVKNLLKKNGGKFVPSGSVSFQFQHVGIIILEPTEAEAAELAAIDAGAEDVEHEDGKMIVTTAITDLHTVAAALADHGTISDARLVYKATQTTAPDDATRTQYEALYDLLDDYADVQEIFDNLA